MVEELSGQYTATGRSHGGFSIELQILLSWQAISKQASKQASKRDFKANKQASKQRGVLLACLLACLSASLIAVNGKIRGGAEGCINTGKEEGMQRRQTMTVLHHHTNSIVVGSLSLIDTKSLPPNSYMR